MGESPLNQLAPGIVEVGKPVIPEPIETNFRNTHETLERQGLSTLGPGAPAARFREVVGCGSVLFPLSPLFLDSSNPAR